MFTGISFKGNWFMLQMVTHLSTCPGNIMLFMAYRDMKLCREQNLPASISSFWSISLSLTKSMIIMGVKSLHLPCKYRMPLFNKFRVASFNLGIGMLVWRHSRWFLISLTIRGISKFLQRMNLSRSPSSSISSFPDTIFYVPGITMPFATLGPKSLLSFKLSPWLFFNSSFT